jgi:hypothetical protein
MSIGSSASKKTLCVSRHRESIYILSPHSEAWGRRVDKQQVTLSKWAKILPLQAIRAWPIRAWSVDRFPSAPSFSRGSLYHSGTPLILTIAPPIFKASPRCSHEYFLTILMEDATAAKRQKRSAGPVADSVDLTLSDDEPGFVEVLEDEPNPNSDAEETLREPSPPPPPPSPPTRPSWRPGAPLTRASYKNMSHVRIPAWYVRHKFGPVELAKEATIPDDLYEKMTRRYKQTEVVGKVPSISITMTDLKRVEGDWLNDELVNFIFEWWRDLIHSGGGPNKCSHSSIANPRCWFASTFFYRKLSVDGETEGYYYKEVARWTKDIDLFADYDVMLIPINEGNTHWYLAVVDFT